MMMILITYLDEESGMVVKPVLVDAQALGDILTSLHNGRNIFIFRLRPIEEVDIRSRISGAKRHC
jgi:hypothetical protein